MIKKQKQLNLPRIYSSTSDKFNKYDGRAKLSYSQYTSWKDEQYKNGYILGYIFGIPQPSNFWAEFGSYCGTLIEYRMNIDKAEGKDKVLLDEAKEYLNKTDIKTLTEADKMFPSNSVYEREIVLDRGSYVTQGFIDVNYDTLKNNEANKFLTNVVDVKTGGKNSKSGKNPAYYGSDKYGQTRLYAKALKEEGEELGYCGVVFLDRTFENKWTHPETTSTFENPILHLSGDILEIETVYTEEKVEVLLKDMDKVAEEISTLKDTYEILSQLTIKL